MPKKAGMEAWKKKRRQEHLEKKKYRYYIFCEGEQTEPQYFAGFKRLIEENPIYKDMVLIEIEPCAAETMRVIGMAERYVKKNKIQKGQIWCVYDKDSFPADDFNSVVLRAERLNKENPELQYHTSWSNECIEFWFLLHFAYYTSNNHRTEYISFLNDKFRELGIGKYQKNMKNIFDILMEKGNPKLAIRYAKRIIKVYAKENDNPLEVFGNYIWICLLETPENQLRYDKLHDKIEERFGIKMPHHMIKMCCKVLEKQGKIKKLPKGAGYKCCDFSIWLSLIVKWNNCHIKNVY